MQDDPLRKIDDSEVMKFKVSEEEVMKMLKNAEHIFVLHCDGVDRPDATVFYIDDGDGKLYQARLTAEYWEKHKTESILKKCTFGGKRGRIK